MRLLTKMNSLDHYKLLLLQQDYLSYTPGLRAISLEEATAWMQLMKDQGHETLEKDPVPIVRAVCAGLRDNWTSTESTTP